MRTLLKGHDRGLLFRRYLTLAGGLLIVAVLLDLGFGQLQTGEQADNSRWLTATFELIERSLAAVPAQERSGRASELGQSLGFGVQLLSRDAIHVSESADHRLTPLIDARGDTSYLYDAESIASIIRLGPIPEVPGNPLLSLLPPLFYLSIFVVVGLWLRPLLRDIDVISNAAQRFAADYRQPLATAGETTELKPLARNLDEMAARVSGVLRSQKELIAALSHEIRTPLARLRFALALSQTDDNPELKSRISSMNEDVQEIDLLISSMLNYARLDHPDINMHWQPVPVKPWLEKIIAKQAAHGIAVEAGSEPCPDLVPMDSRLMELALSNLLVNAIRYAKNRVRCRITQLPGEFVLSVEDDGPGVPAADQQRIFSAFTRLDDSRSRDTGGCGLGLAVVARVAELHRGRASVENSADLGGACFTLRWPDNSA